jgi:hypothetical protein
MSTSLASSNNNQPMPPPKLNYAKGRQKSKNKI